MKPKSYLLGILALAMMLCQSPLFVQPRTRIWSETTAR